MRHKTTFVLLASTLFLITLVFITPFGHAVEWSPNMRLTWNIDSDTFPAVTQASDGTIWVVWCSLRTGNNEIFCKKYNGSMVHPWSSETQLTQNPSEDLAPSVTQASDGTIWVVWMSNRAGNYDIYCKTSSDNGETWSTDSPLIVDPSQDKNPSIMQAENGTIWLVWHSDRIMEDNEIFYATSSDNGETWTTEMLTSDVTVNGEDPAITEAADGTIWVAWEWNFDIFCSFYNGTEWSPEATVTTDPYHDLRPSIMGRQDGAMWVAWNSDRDQFNSTDIYYNILQEGIWLGDTRLTEPEWWITDSAPAILQAADGTTWIAWHSNRQENMDIYYITDSTPDENDVAIFHVEPSQTIAVQGKNASIEVVTQNKGTNAQTFQVSCYNESDFIESKTVSVDPGQLDVVHFQWNTSGVPIGTYTIQAEASTVPGETYTADNTFDCTVGVGVHDVAVTSVAPSETVAQRGYALQVNVEVRNEGNFTETVRVGAYYDSTAIKTITTILYPEEEVTLAFEWKPSVPYGTYNIWAQAQPVSDEADLSDNSLTDGTVLVTIPGDVNGDRIVDVLDVGVVNAHWYPGPPVGLLGYDPNADINNDGNINIFELALVNVSWLKSW